MSIDFRQIGGQAASWAWLAVRSFAGPALVMLLIGAALAAVSYYFFRDQHWAWGLSAVLLALLEAVALGVFLGVKRAAAMLAVHALGSLRLGRILVRLAFRRLLDSAESQAVGERGGRIARGLERMPLAQAEALLTAAVRGALGEAENAGWLRRKLQSRLLEAVRKYTLARFRAEDAAHGGIDLGKVQEELEQTIDQTLIAKIRAGLRFWTGLAVLLLPLVVGLQTWIALALLRSNG